MWTSAKILGTFLLALILFLSGNNGFTQELNLADLIDEAIKNNPGVLASLARIDAAGYRITQMESLPDPMVMFGYQNEGLSKYTYGMEPDAMWMFSASQEFPYPGKLALKGSMAESDLESLKAMHALLVRKTEARVKELYYDLFLSYKNIDLLKDKADLFARIEEVALSRYATGRSMQEEVLMAQMEKYMLLEKEEMYRQKIKSIEAMLSAELGRKEAVSMGRPAEPVYQPFPFSTGEAVDIALANSSEIKSIKRIMEAAGYKIAMAEKEYYPDFTVTTGYSNRGGNFMDMWSTTVNINIPLFYKTKQEPAVYEAKASLAQIEQELEAAKLMISATVKDNLSMVESSEKLMDLYKNGLILKNTQSVESALAGYSTGGTELVVVISLSKSLLDYEILYWGQFVEREKAIARLEAIIEVPTQGSGGNVK
ncbi:MAG TPA: TolC family protein [Desulfatiglandales bacterium]|nr:TolC family protein [Desulfatiglandales bacterium]